MLGPVVLMRGAGAMRLSGIRITALFRLQFVLPGVAVDLPFGEPLLVGVDAAGDADCAPVCDEVLAGVDEDAGAAEFDVEAGVLPVDVDGAALELVEAGAAAGVAVCAAAFGVVSAGAVAVDAGALDGAVGAVDGGVVAAAGVEDVSVAGVADEPCVDPGVDPAAPVSGVFSAAFGVDAPGAAASPFCCPLPGAKLSGLTGLLEGALAGGGGAGACGASVSTGTV